VPWPRAGHSTILFDTDKEPGRLEPGTIGQANDSLDERLVVELLPLFPFELHVKFLAARYQLAQFVRRHQDSLSETASSRA